VHAFNQHFYSSFWHCVIFAIDISRKIEFNEANPKIEPAGARIPFLIRSRPFVQRKFRPWLFVLARRQSELFLLFGVTNRHDCPK
jgi:hypothetical protein